MRSALRLCLVFSLVIVTCWGCAGSKNLLDSIPATINTVKPAKGLNKKIVVALTHTPPNAVGRRVGSLFLKALIDAMREEGPGLQVVSSQDPDWPEGMSELLQRSTAPENILELAARIRREGYNGWACARIENIWPVARKSGVLWFRKERYALFMQMTFTVYDPFSGAKIFDHVVETSTRVSGDDYRAFKSGEDIAVENLDEAIVDAAGDLGENAAEVLNRQPWKTGVVRVDGDRIYLSADGQAGLQPGDRLAVFEARRILEGQNGARFILPGYKIGEIQIVSVDERGRTARELSSSQDTKIQAGDIAVAIQ